MEPMPVVRDSQSRSASSSVLSSALERWPWLPYILPLGIFLLVTSIEPAHTATAGDTGWSFQPDQYPLVYTAKLVLVALALAFVWPAYRTFPFRIGPLAVAVGLVGSVVWIGLAGLDWEERAFSAVGLGSWVGGDARAAYNPFAALGANPAVMYAFLAVRFAGLVLIVPVIEEFFLRGFLMRYVNDQDWTKVPFGVAGTSAIVAGTVFPLLSHPFSEAIPVVVWFSLVTWLMLKTRNIWDCVAAHAITNLALGIYVVATGTWVLW